MSIEGIVNLVEASKNEALIIKTKTMHNTDHKLDAILRSLNFYYQKAIAYNQDDVFEQFVSGSTVSAWLDFSENQKVNINKYEVFHLLIHLEKEELITSAIINGVENFKILPKGISLIEKTGYVKNQKKMDSEYIM